MDFALKDQYLEEVETYLLSGNVDNPYSLLNNINVLIEQDLEEGISFDQIKAQLGSPEELANSYISQQLQKENSKPITNQDLEQVIKQSNNQNDNKDDFSNLLYENEEDQEADDLVDLNKKTHPDQLLEDNKQEQEKEFVLVDDQNEKSNDSSTNNAYENYKKQANQQKLTTQSNATNQQENINNADAYEYYKNLNNNQYTQQATQDNNTNQQQNQTNHQGQPQFSGGIGDKFGKGNNGYLKIILAVLGIFILLRGCVGLTSFRRFYDYGNGYYHGSSVFGSSLTMLVMIGVVVLLAYIFTRKDK